MRIHSLPRKFQDMYLLYCTRSEDPKEALQALVDDLKCLENGVVLLDASQERQVFVVATLISITADNPRLAELLSLPGSNGKINCPLCDGVRQAQTVGNPRETQAVRDYRNANPFSVSRNKRSMRLDGISLRPNVLLDHSSLDLFKMVTIERLHVIHLGVLKYTTGILRADLLGTEAVRATIAARLKVLPSTPWTNLLETEVLDHTASLTGKGHAWLGMRWPLLLRRDDLQTIGTAAVQFDVRDDSHIHPGVCMLLYALTVATSWVAKIYATRTLERDDMDEFCRMHDEAVAAYYRVVLRYDPTTTIVTRPKAHLLRHGGELFRRFGPLTLWDSESREPANGTIRDHVANSNRHNVISLDVLVKWIARDSVQVFSNGGGAIGPGLAAFVCSSRARFLDNKNSVRTWGADSGVSWRDADGHTRIGVVSGRRVVGDAGGFWPVHELESSGNRDEVLVGYRVKQQPPVVIDERRIHSCDMFECTERDGRKVFYRNIMFHDDIVTADDHAAVMGYIDACMNSAAPQ